MPIPDLDNNGLLPSGVYECTLAEVKERFGTFDESDQRVVLFAKLREYTQELAQWGIVREIYIDGSFVTKCAKPNDIDMVIVSHKDYQMPVSMPPAAYNVLSNRLVRKRYGFDIFFVPEGSIALARWIEFFQVVKNVPERKKGILRIAL